VLSRYHRGNTRHPEIFRFSIEVEIVMHLPGGRYLLQKATERGTYREEKKRAGEKI